MLTFLRTEARWILAGFLLTGFSGFGQTYFISLSNDALRETFSLSHGQLGLTYALATLASALILLEFGKIVDRVSTRRAALIVTAGLVTACLMMAGAQALWMLFLAFLGLRLFGQGMMSHVAMTATGRWFDAQRGRAVSLVSLGYPVSEAVLPPLAVAILLVLGFHELWLIGTATVALLAMPALFGLLAKERTPKGEGVRDPLAPKDKVSWRRADALREPALWLLLMGVLCPAFMMTGLFFHQQHLVAVKDWTLPAFAAGFSAFALTQIGVSLLAGALIDRFSARALLPLYLVPMAFGLAMPVVFDGLWVIYLLMVLLGMTGGAAATVMGAIWPELFGLRYLGEIRALTFSAMVASSATSPFLTGFLIDLGIAFPVQLAAMGLYALLASAVMGLIQPRLTAIAQDRVRPSFTPESASKP